MRQPVNIYNVLNYDSLLIKEFIYYCNKKNKFAAYVDYFISDYNNRRILLYNYTFINEHSLENVKIPTTEWTLLHEAIWNDRLDVIKVLIKIGVDVNKIGKMGFSESDLYTPLDLAFYKENLNIIYFLVKNDAKISERSIDYHNNFTRKCNEIISHISQDVNEEVDKNE